MDQSILADADIDEGAKIRNVGDRALQTHSLFEIIDLFDISAESGNREGLAGIARGFDQFFPYVVKRRKRSLNR